ncbi:Rhamnogalacturonate lyase [Melia azedarach]|uniref:Rhamnogalacturonate lyase n=1 Tax=Melia azedarach TaxID=155640 RepID=A0ACC1WXI6_MELAZ|nr:Rhamnogalacturonate lyase [Melia azedarach]
MANQKVKLINKGSYVILDNGSVRLTISKPQGYLIGIQYGGMDNLLDLKLNESSRGYWDINWNLPGEQDRYQLLSGAEYSVIHMSNDCLEVSFKNFYNPSTPGIKLPLSVDIRYILRTGVSGFYCYSIYERDQGSSAFDLAQTRMVFKLRRDKFHYMAITDEKQRIMPMPEDLLPGRGKQLIVPESVLLVNPINPDLKGEVDDKYHHEFRNGGPTKQNLTVHTGPACLAMLHGTHYIGNDILAHFQEGETWRKVFGPFFIYLNSTPHVSNAYSLWIDAKKQRLLEEAAWPYDFVSSPYYLTSKERGSATGTLFVQDKFISSSLIPAKFAYVGLSSSRTQGGWQTESKDYQFWVQTDSNGNFTIKDVVPGVYALHGWVLGFIGDYLDKALVSISAGSQTELGNLIYVPLRNGPTVWEIGYPDRTAFGYYVPDVNPMYVNKLFLNSQEKYRQYGLWDRYTDIHPVSDQVFTIGVNDPKKDWFFAQVDRRGPGNKYLPSTWTIKFNLDSATRSDLKVYVNNVDDDHLVFQEMNLGMDNTVCRHGIHGLYRLFGVGVSSSLLIKGDNSMFLVQARGGDPLCGILYDYLRLEAPVPSS